MLTFWSRALGGLGRRRRWRPGSPQAPCRAGVRSLQAEAGLGHGPPLPPPSGGGEIRRGGSGPCDHGAADGAAATLPRPLRRPLVHPSEMHYLPRFAGAYSTPEGKIFHRRAVRVVRGREYPVRVYLKLAVGAGVLMIAPRVLLFTRPARYPPCRQPRAGRIEDRAPLAAQERLVIAVEICGARFRVGLAVAHLCFFRGALTNGRRNLSAVVFLLEVHRRRVCAGVGVGG
mmetsp:Transcript_91100/g.257943  ORF Transcript_91100/g.257943 Transcript_91100/m.257943 type:complete len:230 (-) Transcript_91100:217-906(-)